MGINQATGFCKYCEERVLVTKATQSATAGVILSVLTLGLYIPLWILGDWSVPWRCSKCGSKTKRSWFR